MRIEGSTALVTGANRGVGRSFVLGLLEAGASKVHAAARDTSKLESLLQHDTNRIVPVCLDITDDAQVEAAARGCGGVDLLVNNAGVLADVGPLDASDLEAARYQMEVNYWGLIRMCRAFGPILGRNGGGAIVNVLSNLALVHIPYQGFYCASKAAALSITQGIRAQLVKQGTLVVAALPDAIDTDMVAHIECDKISPEDVVRASLAAVEEGKEDLFGPEVGDPLDWSRRYYTEPKAVEREAVALGSEQEDEIYGS